MGRNWAIAIGINKYENLTSLKYAKQDANAIADWFGQEAGFDEVFLFTADSPPIEKTNPPIPTSPTYGHLRRFLRAQFENIEQTLLKSGDNLWFFFAGHGLRYRDKDYLMLCDSDPGDVEHTAIAVEYVTERLRRSGADNVVLFLDACRDEGSRGGVGIGREQHQGVITFYSCTANQKSWEFDQLQHGSFTYALLEGLRIQGEANCATVERLNQHLRYYVPRLNARYGKGVQNPYLKAEPPYKMYFILLEQSATLKDVEPLKSEAYKAELHENLLLAEQLWIRILAVSRGDLDAVAAIQRIAVKKVTQPQNSPQESVITNSESDNLPRGTEVEISVTEVQREESERLRQQQEPVTTSVLITRQQFLKWAGFGSAGLVTAVVANEIFKRQSSTDNLDVTESTQSPTTQPTPETKTTSISEAELESFKFETVKVNAKGERVKRSNKQAKFFKEDLGNGVILEMVSIPGGKFIMGTEDEEIERLVKKFDWSGFRREKPQHEVTVEPFFMGKFQITQAQWKTIASLPKIQKDLDLEPSDFKGNDLPVEQVSLEDAKEFCQRISEKTGKEYRLPTEAEWEYACRSVISPKGYRSAYNQLTVNSEELTAQEWNEKYHQPFNFGETITGELANYNASRTFADEEPGKPPGETTPVGIFPPNAFGLYDMHGNVWEWCQDDWHYNYKGASKDGSARLSGDNSKKVIRGGSWLRYPNNCRSAFRLEMDPVARNTDIGFRVVCDASKTT